MNKSINPLMLRLRLYRPDGNPLRRRSDRRESAVVLAAVILVLVSVWPAVLAGWRAYERALHDERAGGAARHQVTATLLRDAPRTRVSFTEVPAEQPTAAVRWTTPAGAERVAEVPVPALARAGSTVKVWLDASGAPAPPPTDIAVLRMRGIATGTLVLLGGALVAVGAVAGWRWRADRRRYREWGLAWERADEQWRHRRQT
ncbi:hypothetical protein HCN51_35125 [Nonomuraea sp. FMUSA5-5]|uniref:DUF3592 domain-containing protein n=1 Tax=Nonomuraea composti TaxID=2720023 RepID=A0ABX1B9Z9_9ACTN|nr:hypothetical protein [Nonomuraea sp. FMUSA5-5]NJP94614.1 hypothetical protein [Nonomuraea sp. FMUSA5-5]